MSVCLRPKCCPHELFSDGAWLRTLAGWRISCIWCNKYEWVASVEWKIWRGWKSQKINFWVLLVRVLTLSVVDCVSTRKFEAYKSETLPGSSGDLDFTDWKSFPWLVNSCRTGLSRVCTFKILLFRLEATALSFHLLAARVWMFISDVARKGWNILVLLPWIFFITSETAVDLLKS